MTIRTLFTNLAAVTITYTNEKGRSVSVQGIDLSGLPSVWNSARTPVRVLLPMQNWQAGGSALERISVGTAQPGMLVNWNVTDLFLLAPVGTKTGLADFFPDLVIYAGAYVAQIGANIELTTNFTFQGLDINIVTTEFPKETGNWFYGVEAVSQWQQLVNP